MHRHRTFAGCVAVALAGALSACGLNVIGLGGPPPGIDQVNLLDGTVVDQGIGRFDELDGSPDPSGTVFDLQDAQTFTAGATGQLAIVQLGIVNEGGATQAVLLEIREVERDPSTLEVAPTPDDSLAGVLGTVALPAAVFTDVDPADPDTWPAFDVSVLGVSVTAGVTYCVSVRTADPVGFTLAPEMASAYAGGAAWRRNRAIGAAWTEMLGADFGFRTWVWAP